MKIRLFLFIPTLVMNSFFLVIFSCGKASKNDSDSPAPVPTATVVATEPPESSSVPFWLAANSKDGGGPVAVRFDSTGRLSLTVDLYEVGVDYGPITAFHFMDSNTLMFFVDGGAGKETIGTFDVKTALIKNKAWGAESSIKAALSGSRVNSMITGLQLGVLHTQTSAGVKSIRYGNDGGVSAEDFFVATSDAAAACPMGTVTSSAIVTGNSNTSLALLSSGTATRLNVLYTDAGLVSCRSSFDYSAGPETTAQHKPVSILQAANGKIYVLYQHETTPLVMRYDFDGTTLSSPQKIYSGLSNLGKTPLGMIARTNKRLLIGRPDVGSLIEILLKGNTAEQTDFYKKTSFAKDLTALIAEPN